MYGNAENLRVTEAAVRPVDRYIAPSTRQDAESAGKHLGQYLLAREKKGGNEHAEREILDLLVEGHSNGFTDDTGFWVAYLHCRALAGNGLISNPEHRSSFSARPVSGQDAVLQPPSPGSTPLALRIIKRIFALTQTWLEINGFDGPPTETVASVIRVL